jgi:hypothetical protein
MPKLFHVKLFVGLMKNQMGIYIDRLPRFGLAQTISSCHVMTNLIGHDHTGRILNKTPISDHEYYIFPREASLDRFVISNNKLVAQSLNKIFDSHRWEYP